MDRFAYPKRPRESALDDVGDYLVGADVQGHYVEFGVYRGETFAYALDHLAPLFPKMNFVAFDSFQGLPSPVGIDRLGHYRSGQYAATKAEFLNTIRPSMCNPDRIRIVPGWFAQTLTPESNYGVPSVALAWIDCDLYESTVPVLSWLTKRVEDGGVIVFDDWRCFRNKPHLGQQRACSEWLQNNSDIALRELLPVGWHGIAFSVDRGDSAPSANLSR